MNAPEHTDPFPDDHEDLSLSGPVDEFGTLPYINPLPPAAEDATGPGQLEHALSPEDQQTQFYVPSPLPSVDRNPTPTLLPLLPGSDGVDVTSTREIYAPEWNPQGMRVPSRIPGYRILSYLGQGGSSTVFRGRDLELGIDVAIKIQHYHHGDLDQQQEAAEVRHCLGSLRHPNLVALYGAGTNGQNPYLVMELIEGTPMNLYRQGEPRAEHTSIVRIMEQTARGAAYLHSQGLLHRDIKPGNILVDGNGRVRLADYGLTTRWPCPVEIAEGQIFGTPAFMAPEQVLGRPRDFGPGMDIWAIGVSLFWLLSDVSPFRRDSVPATLQAVMNQEAPLLRTAWPEAPPALERICARCLRRDPSERYLCADELADELLAFLDGKLVEPQPTPARSWWRFWGRG